MTGLLSAPWETLASCLKRPKRTDQSDRNPLIYLISVSDRHPNHASKALSHRHRHGASTASNITRCLIDLGNRLVQYANIISAEGRTMTVRILGLLVSAIFISNCMVPSAQEIEQIDPPPNLIVYLVPEDPKDSLDGGVKMTVFVNGVELAYKPWSEDDIELSVPPGPTQVTVFAAGVGKFNVSPNKVTDGMIEISSQMLGNILHAELKVDGLSEDGVLVDNTPLTLSLLNADGIAHELAPYMPSIMVEKGDSRGKTLFLGELFAVRTETTITAQNSSVLIDRLFEAHGNGQFLLRLEAADAKYGLPIGDFGLVIVDRSELN